MPVCAADDEAAPTGDDIFRVDLSAGDAARAAGLLRALGANRWTERAEATESLKEIGVGVIRLLRSEYCDCDDLEVKLRIEEICVHVYRRFHVYDRFGFLGISQQPVPFTHDNDSRIPKGHVGIDVLRVHENTAAHAAELHERDVIFAINGRYIAESFQPSADFGAMIRDLGPGTNVTLTILRKGRLIKKPVTLRSCPPHMVESGQIFAVSEELQSARRKFPTWWTNHFSRRACKR